MSVLNDVFLEQLFGEGYISLYEVDNDSLSKSDKEAKYKETAFDDLVDANADNLLFIDKTNADADVSYSENHQQYQAIMLQIELAVPILRDLTDIIVEYVSYDNT